MVIVEAFAVGLPVLGSNIGGVAELLSDGKVGRRFTAGSSEALRLAADELLTDPQSLNDYAAGARTAYLSRFSPDANYKTFMDIYDATIASFKRSVLEGQS